MKNLDGINKKINNKKYRIVVKVESRVITSTISTRVNTDYNFNWKNLFSIPSRVPVIAVIVLLVMAFGAGSWSVLSTEKIKADAEPQILGVLDENNLIKVTSEPVSVFEGGVVPNEQILSLTLNQIEGYLNEALKTPELKNAEILASRKEKLKKYLEEKHSPFVSIVDTIAELKHWKLVLAISNSESTLGKRCYTNNCSGIGVEPGHPLWREYETKADWAKDLDRLIEKRYKDWKLEEMNGVYNKPGSANWIYAATQIIEELKERGIE